VGLGPVAAEPVHRPLDSTRPVTAAPVTTPFAIEYFGLEARLRREADRPREVGSAPLGEVRFHTAGRCSAWQALGQDGAQATTQFTAALVSVDRADAYQVRGLPAVFEHPRATVMNLTDGPVTARKTTFGTAAGAASNCRSRGDWNADESITAWTKGTDTQAFAPDQVLTVHHTAGSNDPNQNYANTVLAIEEYHVKTNGWSDIGYQYLIDPNGVVYEGRNAGHTSASCLTQGGDGGDFAHRLSDDQVVTGAHVGGYNTGNLGIALLGCFDSSDSTCTQGGYPTTPSAAAISALEQLLARLATRHGLNATATTTYANSVNTKTNVPTISGHRDWEATACPGDNVYTQLPTLRSRVSTDMTPANLQATATDTTVDLAWRAGTAWPGAPSATRYRVTREGGPTWTTSGLSFTDGGLAPSTMYSYTVTSLATDGSASSPAAAVSVTTAPGTPAVDDFAITVTPSTATTSATNPAVATVETSATGSSAPALSLRAAVSPSGTGVTPQLGSSALTAGQSTSLTVMSNAASSGTYVVTVTATSSSGTTHYARFTLTVANGRPTAAITSATCSGGSCTFAGTAADPEGGPLTLAWSMPGGSPSSSSGGSGTTTKYTSVGTYTVTFTATDQAQLVGSATSTVTCTRAGKSKSKVSCTASA
jgi:hypothetical protein